MTGITRTRFATRRTSELKVGDVVLCHGMRCLVDRELAVSGSHPDSPGVGDGKTRWTAALVLNRDDVPRSVVPYGFTATTTKGVHRWTIQGNDLATWAVEAS